MNTPARYFSVALLLASTSFAFAELNIVTNLAPDIYFHEGDLKGHGHCNNGWIVFEDYVLVIDGNFPSGAKEIIPKIHAITDKPIRFAFDTHHHGDHAYGNQVWVENGATPVAYAGVVEEMKKFETGYYGNTPGRWEDSAKGRPDVAASKLKPPTLLFTKDMIFDDGKHRVELLHFGVAHTRGDGFAWLPKERILFTGDACVNGPYNFAGDGNIEQWVKTLELARKLGAKTICPGHGPIGGESTLKDQQEFFFELRKQVKKYSTRKPEQIKDSVDKIKSELQKNERIARYVGDFFPAQVEKAYTEMGGKPFLSKTASNDDHSQHAEAHGNEKATHQ
ncbi:MAG: fold metallo-hydrolase [Verrucomicrobiales bacterium]|nr:fold metallo-hydrolase [Verrucomicrobiales bacterium]